MTRRIIAPEWVIQGFEFPTDVEVTFNDDLPQLPDEVIASAQFIVIPYMQGPKAIQQSLPRMKNVEVIQLLTAGFDNIYPHMPAGVKLCNAGGVHDDSTSEMALTLALSALRDIPESVSLQKRNLWGHYFSHSLADKKVLLIGYGGVGKAIERRLIPFECDVIPVATNARDHVKAIEELPNLIPDADLIFLAVPLNDKTKGLVDHKFLSKMKPGALLVNVARGPVVDTMALVEALNAGKIRAALDVTDPEPLPTEHPLWQAPNCLITPHLGGDTDIFEKRARRRIHGQLERWLTNAPLDCVIIN
jgi:phosphoglycerate dehydrogenase-like enzyme